MDQTGDAEIERRYAQRHDHYHRKKSSLAVHFPNPYRRRYIKGI